MKKQTSYTFSGWLLIVKKIDATAISKLTSDQELSLRAEYVEYERQTFLANK
jgi:hypothetical protein